MRIQKIRFKGSLKLAFNVFKPDNKLTKYICQILEGMKLRFHPADHDNVILSIIASRRPTWLGRPESGKFKIRIKRTDVRTNKIIINDKFYSDEI